MGRCPKRGEPHAQSEKSFDRHLSRTHGIFDREHNIVRRLAELANERKIYRALGNDFGAIALYARHELARDIGHHAGYRVRMPHQDIEIVVKMKVRECFPQEFRAGAIRHSLLDEVALPVGIKAVAPPHDGLLWLAGISGIVMWM